MIYQVVASMFFDKKDEALDFLEKAEHALDKSVVVNPDKENMQGGFISLNKCYHDEVPVKPCVVCLEMKCEP